MADNLASVAVKIPIVLIIIGIRKPQSNATYGSSIGPKVHRTPMETPLENAYGKSNTKYNVLKWKK